MDMRIRILVTFFFQKSSLNRCEDRHKALSLQFVKFVLQKSSLNRCLKVQGNGVMAQQVKGAQILRCAQDDSERKETE